MNLVKKAILFFICITVIAVSIPITQSTVVNNSTNNNIGPIVDIMIFTKLSLFTITFIVENIGDAPAHNVMYSGITIAGKVIYNSRSHLIIEELEPGGGVYGWSDRFIGYGMFVAKITVTCDEGYMTSSSANGIVFGPINFIP